jgi:hypothetical protein
VVSPIAAGFAVTSRFFTWVMSIVRGSFVIIVYSSVLF